MKKRVSGIWWLSDSPDNKIAGDLLIEDRKLELTGSFKGLQSSVYDSTPKLVKTDQQTTIQGVARNGGNKYTLEYFTNPISFTIHSYKADTYYLGDIFIGEHIDKIENLAFDRYYVELPYLYEWLDDGVVTIHNTFKDNPLKRESTVIVINDVKTTEIYEDENIILALVSSVGRIPIFPVEKNINIEQKCVLGIKAKKGKLPLTEAWGIIQHFQRFLIIATGRSLEPIDIKVNTGNAMDYTTLLPSRFQKKYYKNINAHDMNFTFKDIKTERKVLFTEWFTYKDKYADVFDLFSALRSDVPKMLENQFKDIVGAIEGYVRIEQKKFNISLEKAIKTLNDALPKNNRLFSKSDIKKIRLTRNKLSHVVIKQENLSFILNHEDMWFTYEKLLILFEYSVLKNLGLSEEMLKKFYNKRKKY
jgi:hypothetical protein